MSQKMREALIAYIEAGVGNSTDYEKQADARSLAMEALAAKPAQGEAVDSMGMPISCGKPLCSVNDHHPLCRLYAAPPAPSVPDEIKYQGDTDWNDDFDQGYREGWNACRAAMLAAAPARTS